jgi:hypothetical protein
MAQTMKVNNQISNFKLMNQSDRRKSNNMPKINGLFDDVQPYLAFTNTTSGETVKADVNTVSNNTQTGMPLATNTSNCLYGPQQQYYF